MPVRNSCDCPHPPGGRVDCEPHQAAVCVVQDGNVNRGCYDPPSTDDDTQLVDWAFTLVTGETRTKDEVTAVQRDLRILLSGHYESFSSQGLTRKVAFTLPEDVVAAVRELMKDSGTSFSSAGT